MLFRSLWAGAATTASVMLVGGITRLTHSGLSMVEWQPIVGVMPPLDDAQWAERFEQYRRFPEYQVRRDMSLAEFKRIFFWEYLHRLLARSIGLIFLVPFIAFWRAGYLPPPLARRMLFLFACGAAQGALGWWMVRSGLVDRPSVARSHPLRIRREARSALRKLTFDLSGELVGGTPDDTPVRYLAAPGSGDARERLRSLSDALLRRKEVGFRYYGIYRDTESDRRLFERLGIAPEPAAV